MNTFSPQMAAIGEGRTPAAGAPPSIWLGYAPTGGHVSIRYDELKGKLLIAGHSADNLASLLAYTLREAGVKTLILDVDGHLSERVSGYFETYDYTCFLYDAFQIEEEGGPMHGQLIAAAYTAAMDLTSEEEAIMNAAMQKLLTQDTKASPVVLFEVLATVEGFRGFYVEKLQGRVAALKFLESPENGSLTSLLSLGGSLVSFSDARYPQAAEVAVAIFIAKLLSMFPGAKSKPDVLIVNDAHRIFRSNPRPQHVNRLLSELLDASVTVVLVSDQKRALNESLQDAIPVKILSSDAWNDKVESRWREHTHDAILPNSYAIADGHFGHQRTFIPRAFETRVSEPRKGPGVMAQMKAPDNELTKLILEDIKRYDTPTPVSIVEFLSGDYGAENVKHELDRLHSQGLIRLDAKERRDGSEAMLVYALTENGSRLLEVL